MNHDLKREAILNEIKGNLFEYLVALKLAQHFKMESAFVNSLPDQFNELLRNYDYHIRTYYPELLYKLPVLADSLADEIRVRYHDVQAISLVGKIAGAAHNQAYSEADILLHHQDDKVTPLSIKLCRHGSFMNTKSGGISSFIKKYFSHQSAYSQQQELNEFVDLSFDKMARELHDHHDLDYQGDFKKWKSLGLPVLPGELDENSKKILYAYYHCISVKLHSLLKDASQEDPELFARSLYSLIGFGRQDLIQAIVTHDKYQIKSVLVKEFNDCKSELVCLDDHDEKISNFEIHVDKVLLQIRIKPMNQFTARSFKVNCSIKYS